MDSSDFNKYSSRFERKILETFRPLLTEAMVNSVYDIEKTSSGNLFTAEFSNGEVFRLFTHDSVAGDFVDAKISNIHLCYNSEEDMILLYLAFESFLDETWYVFIEYYKEEEKTG